MAAGIDTQLRKRLARSQEASTERHGGQYGAAQPGRLGWPLPTCHARLPAGLEAQRCSECCLTDVLVTCAGGTGCLVRRQARTSGHTDGDGNESSDEEAGRAAAFSPKFKPVAKTGAAGAVPLPAKSPHNHPRKKKKRKHQPKPQDSPS